jgi:uncharacterized membrane protein SirB2
MLYLTVKYLHVTCVVLSISGFCLRGLLLMRKSALMRRHWIRVVPHVNDSILLAAGIALTVLLGQYPFVDAWLTAKIFGLLAYILLGALALKPGRDPRWRMVSGLAAVGVFGWIVSVALSKHPMGLFAW